jgi:hypothetical protein
MYDHISPISSLLRNISDKRCGENRNTHILLNNFFKNRPVYEIIWEIIIEPDSSQMTIWCICWILTSTDMHSEYVTIIDFPLQQLFHKHASMLRYSTLPVLLYSLQLNKQIN